MLIFFFSFKQCILGIIEKMTFEQIFERGDEVNHMDIWGKTVSNRSNILGVF